MEFIEQSCKNDNNNNKQLIVPNNSNLTRDLLEKLD